MKLSTAIKPHDDSQQAAEASVTAAEHNMENLSASSPPSEHSSGDTSGLSQSTNNDALLTNHMNQLSLSATAAAATATALPPSSPVASPAQRQQARQNGPSAASTPTAKAPLRQAPTSSPLGAYERSTPPILRKRISLSSLQGASTSTPPRSPALRSISSHFASSPNATMGGRSSLPPPVEEPPKPPTTAATVAHDFFEKDLQVNHNGSEVMGDAQTVVILQDDCYGHRYSRPRTSKANLSTIFERPERIYASILGLATAYVRLGGRHANGAAAPSPQRHPTTLPRIPFKIHKTARRISLRSPAATAIHGTKWMTELSSMCDAAESKLALSGKELTRPPTADNADGSAEKPKLHEGDLYLCSGSLNALEGALGGVCEAVDAVFSEKGAKRAFVCVRPPGHHCSADMPSGFCWLNNVHVGIGHASITHGLTHAAIIDFDLHHGDGSQSITWAHNSRVASLPKNTPLSKKTAIGYFSLHDINSYPCEMGDDDEVRNASLCIENAHGQTIWNVHLQPWKTEAEFWSLYEQRYITVLAKARTFLRSHSDRLRQAPTHPKPKAAIFLSAGFDASEWESPGMQRHQVNVPTSFYARFTRDVVMMAEEEALGVDGRVISVLEGGYSDRALMSGVLSHISGLTTPTKPPLPLNNGNGLGYEMGRRLGNLDLNSESGQVPSAGQNNQIEVFDERWWSLPYLEEIETLVNPPTVAAPPKKQRNDVRPTYTSATQSYTAKIVSPPQGRRSFSGSSAMIQNGSAPASRAPSPPPPPVNWATAAHELCKLLVPSDKETRSCKPEELNAEASRARRDRHSNIGLPVEAPTADLKRIQLRDKRSKQPTYAEEDEEEQNKPVSRASRRKTIADVKRLTEETVTLPLSSGNQEALPTARHTRRRSSMASSVGSMGTDRASDFTIPSVMENHAQRDPLIIKKARAPTSARPEATKLKPAKKTAPVPRIPSDSSTTMTQAASAPALNGQISGRAPLAVNEDSKNKDVEQLASGMRQMSIKLHVPSKEEHDARQAKPKPAPRGRPAKATTAKSGKTGSPNKGKSRAPAVKKPVESATNGANATVQYPDPVAEPEARVPTAAQFPLTQETHQPVLDPAHQISLPPYSFSQPEPQLSTPGFNNVAPAQPAPIPAPIPQMQNTPPHLAPTETPLPPSSPDPISPNTPITAKRTKQDLPVFTSTSPISFGNQTPVPNSINHNVMTGGPAPAPQARPSAPPPQEKPAIGANTTPHNGPLGQGLPLKPHSPTRNNAPKEENGSETSIWDIPDTPRPRKL